MRERLQIFSVTQCICVLFIFNSCSRTTLSGAAGKVSNGGSPTSSKSPQSPEPSPKTTSAIPVTYFDPNGIIKDECKDIRPLPGTTTGLVLQYDWHASGDLAEFTNVVATPIVGRLKSTDPAPTILAVGFKVCVGDVSQPAYLFAIDGRDGSQKWVRRDLPIEAGRSPAIGDLNGDGILEIVVIGKDNKLHVLDNTGGDITTSTEDVIAAGTALYSTGLTVADLGGDGQPMIVAGTKIFDGKNAVKKFSLAGNGFSSVGDVDGKPGLEVITSTGIYQGKDGVAICTFAEPIDEPTPAVMSGVADHGSVVGITQSKVIVYDGKDCTPQKSFDKSITGGGPINIADFNGDGILDFGTAGRDSYEAFGLSGSLWTTPTKDTSSERTGSTTFDFNGAGKNQVVYADEEKLHVFDGSTGKELYTADHASYTARETPSIADVTGNGKARIVVGANSCLPGASISGIRVFRDPEDAWVNTRPIWNQHTYSPLLVGDNGTLTQIEPESVSKPWLKKPYLAGFRNNIPQPQIKSSCK